MLPQTAVARLLSVRMAPTMLVTVLLPLDPLMATAGASAYELASSTSLTGVIPSARAARNGGACGWIPGEATTTSASRQRASG